MDPKATATLATITVIKIARRLPDGRASGSRQLKRFTWNNTSGFYDGEQKYACMSKNLTRL